MWRDFFLLVVFYSIGAATPSLADELTLEWPSAAQATKLVGLVQGGELSDLVKKVRNQSYELQDGRMISMDKWYQTDWVNLKLTFLTEVNQHLGILWGLGTGEIGPKYKIEPSIQLGFLYTRTIVRGTTLSFRLSQRFAGRLIENTCLASYGVVSEELQPVNCRLAASDLPPSETLQYLLNRESLENQPSWFMGLVMVF